MTRQSFKTSCYPLASIHGASTVLALSSTMLQVLPQWCSLPSSLTHHNSTNLQANFVVTPEGLHEVSQLDALVNMPSWNQSSLRSHTLVTCPITCSKVSSILATDYAHAYCLSASLLGQGPYLMLAAVIYVFTLNNPLLQCLPLDSNAKTEQTKSNLLITWPKKAPLLQLGNNFSMRCVTHDIAYKLTAPLMVAPQAASRLLLL